MTRLPPIDQIAGVFLTTEHIAERGRLVGWYSRGRSGRQVWKISHDSVARIDQTADRGRSDGVSLSTDQIAE